MRLASFAIALLSCMIGHETSVKLRDDGTSPSCRFCNVSPERDFDIVWKSPSLVVFRDFDPAAQQHLLVVPVKHIRSVKDLRAKDIPLLREMRNAGHRVLDTLNVPPDSRRLGFHIPPFNSVAHLHLHTLGLPFRSTYRRAKYPISSGRPGKTKGFSWFVEIDQAIDILDRGGTIGIFPC